MKLRERIMASAVAVCLLFGTMGTAALAAETDDGAAPLPAEEPAAAETLPEAAAEEEALTDTAPEADYEVSIATDIEEQETPLGLFELTEDCCVLHLLILLVALATGLIANLLFNQ